MKQTGAFVCLQVIGTGGGTIYVLGSVWKYGALGHAFCLASHTCEHLNRKKALMQES